MRERTKAKQNGSGSGSGRGELRHRSKGGRRNPLFPDVDLKRAARKAGISPQHLSLILLKKRKPSLTVALKVSALLGVKVEDMAGRSRNRTLEKVVG